MMTQPYYQDEHVTLYHGDCLDVLRELPDASVDAVVTDPPYGLEFMGREWDSFGGDTRQPFRGEIQTPDNPYGRSTVRFAGASSYGARAGAMKSFQDWCEQWATECLRVLKPGGHLLAFGGSRTWHRLACAVEDAGFEIRDSIAWLYGQGFPKSLNVAKAIESGGGRPEDIRRLAMGDDYQPSGRGRVNYDHGGGSVMNGATSDVPLSPAAQQWQGWGTALKPAHEPVVCARKPLAGTVAANVLAHGTGALNIAGCRVSASGPNPALTTSRDAGTEPAGRWPTNVVLDDATAAELDRQSGTSVSRVGKPRTGKNGAGWGMAATGAEYDDQGGASRFFPTFRYEAKAPTAERPKYWAHDCDCPHDEAMRPGGTCETCGAPGKLVAHPTVKPLDLMRWLVRLVTPPGGTVLEPFAGSGTTAEACVIEGLRCIAIEREADYLPLIVARLTKPIQVALDLDGGAA